MKAPIPLIEHKGKGTSPALVQKQVPAELVVVLLLRTDIENDVSYRQDGFQLVTIGQVIAVQIGRIDDDFVLKGRTIVRRQPAMAKRWIKSLGTNGFVVINYRIPCRRTCE